MDKVDVSIIIPVYNVAEYLATCLESVIKQTIKRKEIIIINDGSTDGCYEILTEYKKEFPELIIINQENKGISETRNAGLRAATGEFIAFVDSDDFIELNMFEKMYSVAKRENADIVIGDYILYNDTTDKENSNGNISDKEIIAKCISDKYKIEGIDKEGHIDKIEALKMFLLNDIKAYVWNKLHKRDLFIQNKICFPDFKVCEDTPVGFLLLAGSNKIFSMGEPLYYYRQRETSLTKTFSIKSMEDMLEGCYIMRDYLEKNPPLYEKLKDHYRAYLIKTLWAIYNKYFLQCCQNGRKSNYDEFKKIVSKEVSGIRISEIIANKKLTLKDKVNAILIKTRTYGLIFPVLYKLRNQKIN